MARPAKPKEVREVKEDAQEKCVDVPAILDQIDDLAGKVDLYASHDKGILLTRQIRELTTKIREVM